MSRGRPPEPRYLWCDTCATLLEPVEANSPAFSEPVVIRVPTDPSPHHVEVLRRSELRERVGDLTAIEALERLQRHRSPNK